MSLKGTQFIIRHEGFVSKAYRDPVGIITIGTGFTNRSKTVRQWWKMTRDRPIQMGDTISKSENAKLLKAAIEYEYGKPVGPALGKKAPQHAIDAGVSVSFNCGPGSLKWTWATLYKSGQHSRSSERLRTTAVTARGRKLPGLVRRRREEADLLLYGNYHLDGSAVRFGTSDSEQPGYDAQLQQDQKLLNKIGYDCGTPDGLWGGKTKAAVRKLQSDHDLIVDGILGPATRAKIQRLANAKREAKGAGAAGGGSAAGGAGVDTAAPAADLQALSLVSDLLLYGGLAVLVIGFAYLAWFYRDEINSFLRRL